MWNAGGGQEAKHRLPDHLTEKPFFAYYPMVLVHSPWPQTPDNINDPQPEWTAQDNLRIPESQKWSRPNFKSMVEYTDTLIGRVAAAIEDLGIAEDTLLIVTADNGTFKRASSAESVGEFD